MIEWGDGKPPVMNMTLPERSGMSWSRLNLDVTVVTEAEGLRIWLGKVRDRIYIFTKEKMKIIRHNERADTYTSKHSRLYHKLERGG
jgi:hypothetical protein